MAQTHHPLRRRKAKPRNPEATRARLIGAAQTLFNAKGFDATNSNRIARKAGFAPQTFYRHFPDKTAIFLAVADRWWRAEAEIHAKVFAAANRTPGAAARALLGFHTEWRIFRRALRHLAVSTPAVARAHHAARQAQLAALASLCPVPPGSRPHSHISALLTLERLCDAAADGELADLGLSQRAILSLIAQSLPGLRGASRP